MNIIINNTNKALANDALLTRYKYLVSNFLIIVSIRNIERERVRERVCC